MVSLEESQVSSYRGQFTHRVSNGKGIGLGSVQRISAVRQFSGDLSQPNERTRE